MTYSQRNISGHVDTLSQDLQSQACLIWQLLYIRSPDNISSPFMKLLAIKAVMSH